MKRESGVGAPAGSATIERARRSRNEAGKELTSRQQRNAEPEPDANPDEAQKK